MAIYHLTANIISRGRGQSVVAAAAYRSGTALRDERYGVTHNYIGKRAVVHSEVMAPPVAPSWVCDREMLWNRVEARELRKDSQLARLVEIGLPVELSGDERLALVRDFIATEFVPRGMIADFSIRADAINPHAHILLTLRGVTAAGFGSKERRWNGKAALLEWRSAWAAHANMHLARAGHAVRIDHRTLEAQHIELAPGRRIGFGTARRSAAALPSHLTERIDEQQRIVHDNGETILRDPTVALRALTHQRPVFTQHELAQFLRSRTSGTAQFDAALGAVTHCADLVTLEPAAGGQGRFTSRDMIEAETSLMRRAASMTTRRGHGVAPDRQSAVAAQFGMNDAVRRAFDYLVSDGDAKALAAAGADKDVLLAAARQAWDAEGFAVVGAEWRPDSDVLSRGTVLVVDGSHRLGAKELERVLAAADLARAKAVCIADLKQLQAMNVASPFQRLLRQVGLAREDALSGGSPDTAA
ncbi:MAG: MobQ family relaxase [Steroidobacteraceae bacterium]